MSRELEKVYEPKAVEDRWYRVWVERGYFHADPAKGGPASYTAIFGETLRKIAAEDEKVVAITAAVQRRPRRLCARDAT